MAGSGSSMSSTSNKQRPLSRAISILFAVLIVLQLWTIYMNSTCRCEEHLMSSSSSIKEELLTLRGLEEWRAQQPTLSLEEKQVIEQALSGQQNTPALANQDRLQDLQKQFPKITIPKKPNKQQTSQTHPIRSSDMSKEELELAQLVDQSTVTPPQHEPYRKDSTLAVLGNEMDRIYILCYWKCTEVDWIPVVWRTKQNTKVVDGHVFDSHRKVNNTWGSWKAHNQAVTVMHRAVVAHAKRQHAKMAMILEEDVAISSQDVTPRTAQWAQSVLAGDEDDWDIIRLSHYWYTDYIRRFLQEEEKTHALQHKNALEPIEKRLLNLAGKGLFQRSQWDTCPTDCICTTTTQDAKGVCTLTPNQDAIHTMLKEKDWYWKSFILGTSGMCDLRSSSAYIVPSRSFDYLISKHHNQDWASIIDLVRINALAKQKILYPMPTVQKKNYGHDSAIGFESMCVVDESTKNNTKQTR